MAYDQYSPLYLTERQTDCEYKVSDHYDRATEQPSS